MAFSWCSGKVRRQRASQTDSHRTMGHLSLVRSSIRQFRGFLDWKHLLPRIRIDRTVWASLEVYMGQEHHKLNWCSGIFLRHRPNQQEDQYTMGQSSLRRPGIPQSFIFHLRRSMDLRTCIDCRGSRLHHFHRLVWILNQLHWRMALGWHSYISQRHNSILVGSHVSC